TNLWAAPRGSLLTGQGPSRHGSLLFLGGHSPDMVIKEGQSVNLECSKKKSTNTAMYWFMLPSEKNSSLTQLVYAYEGANAVVEKGFESHFKSSKIKGDSITLSIEHAFLNDSGTYYCAESEHSGETAEGAEHKPVPAQTGPAFQLWLLHEAG
uniref:Ig-like domain-containing protein n=1 Tax=Zonotrichia albicollis TaxID=44394 RepID=A0A8D2M219_ZONAL